MKPPDVAAEYVSIDSLLPWPKNPRKNGRAVTPVAESMQRFGFGAPILARKANREIIAGHTRVLAAKKLGLSNVPVRFLDLDEKEAHALALHDNKLQEFALWDEELLDQELRLADDKTREIFGQSIEGEGVTEELEEAPVEGPADSESGRVYELGPHRLFVGDSRGSELGEGAKLQIADPPFDLEYDQWSLLSSCDVLAVWFRSMSAIKWALSVTAESAEDWGMHLFAFTGGVRGHHNDTLPCCMHENVMILRRKWWKDKAEAIDRKVIRASGCAATAYPDSRPISWQENSGGVLAAQSIGMSWAKPILQFEILMAYVPRGSIVWDPCAGSGSSLIAAAKHGRVWRGCELQPQWADLIRRRWTKWARENGADPGEAALEPVTKG